MLVCLFCRHEWQEARVEEEFGLGVGIDELEGTVVAGGAEAIASDDDVLTLTCGGCGADVVVDTAHALNARCHWCRHTLNVNERTPNGAVPDAVLPFRLTHDEAVEKIREFASKRRLFAHPRFKKEFVPENVLGVYLPYLVIDARAEASYTGKGEVQTRRWTEKVGDSSTTYYAADVYRVDRSVAFTVDDLTVEGAADRANFDDSTTNNIVNTVLPFDTKNAVKWNSSYLVGFTSEKRDLDVGDLQPVLEDQLLSIGRSQVHASLAHVRPRRALGGRAGGRRRLALGLDVPAGVALLLLPGEHQDAALHRGERPHGGDDGQRAGLAAEAHRGGTDRRHLPRGHRRSHPGGHRMIPQALAEVVMATSGDNAPLWLLAAGPAGGAATYWALYRYYRNTDKSHAYERDTLISAQPVQGSDDKIDHISKTRKSGIDGDNSEDHRERVERVR